MTDKPLIQAPRKTYRGWHILLTAIYGVVLVFSLPLAFRSLTLGPAEGVSETAFLFFNLSIAAVPFTIAISLAAAWIYHRGGAGTAYAFAPYGIPLINAVAIAILRTNL